MFVKIILKFVILNFIYSAYASSAVMDPSIDDQ